MMQHDCPILNLRGYVIHYIWYWCNGNCNWSKGVNYWPVVTFVTE